MPLGALLLALGAAVLHACWNLLLARESDTEAAMAVAMATMVLVTVPAAVLTWDVEPAVLPYAAASGALELAYVALLAAAYARFDLSVVYPVARGLAPVAALALSVALVGTSPTGAEIAGVLAVTLGVLLVRGAHSGPGVAAGLAIGLVIGGYTVVDRSGIQHAAAAPYLLLVMLPAALFSPLLVRDRRRIRGALGPGAVLVGVGSACAFLLALLALRRAPAASVAAVRETSVVIAAALAALVLREPVGPRRLTGAVAVVIGVALLALG